MRYLSVTRSRKATSVTNSYSYAWRSILLTLFVHYCSELLKLGSSKPWPDAIRMLTRGRTSRMDAGAIMEYFQPLMEWLKKQNTEETAGWSELQLFSNYGLTRMTFLTLIPFQNNRRHEQRNLNQNHLGRRSASTRRYVREIVVVVHWFSFAGPFKWLWSTNSFSLTKKTSPYIPGFFLFLEISRFQSNCSCTESDFSTINEITKFPSN